MSTAYKEGAKKQAYWPSIMLFFTFSHLAISSSINFITSTTLPLLQ